MQGRFRNITKEQVEYLETNAENYYNKLVETEAR